MVSLNMLILEVGVEYFGICEHSEGFVVRFSSVDQFVSGLSLN